MQGSSRRIDSHAGESRSSDVAAGEDLDGTLGVNQVEIWAEDPPQPPFRVAQHICKLLKPIVMVPMITFLTDNYCNVQRLSDGDSRDGAHFNTVH